MERADWHTYQVLTKRSSLLLKFVNARHRRRLRRHIWLGVSVEDQKATSRMATPDREPGVRFLSIERSRSRRQARFLGIDWVIVGGESGQARVQWTGDRRFNSQPVHQGTKWRSSFKQWGGPSPKAGGRLLDGKGMEPFRSDAARRRDSMNSRSARDQPPGLTLPKSATGPN